MNPNKQKILLFLVIIAIVFCGIKLYPSNTLSNQDILIISLITSVTCIFYNSSITEKYTQPTDNTQNTINPFTIINTLLKETPTTQNQPNTSNIVTKSNVTDTQTTSTVTGSSDEQTTKTNIQTLTNISNITPVSNMTKTEVTKPVILFPFTLEFLTKVFDDINKAKTDDVIAKQIFDATKTLNELEILVQIYQSNFKIKKEQETPIRELSQSQNKYLESLLTSNKYLDDSGFINNIVDNDMSYTMYKPEQNQKLGSYDSTFTNKWTNDYVLLNTNKWAPEFNHKMYKCKSEKTCPVCPNMTTGYPVRVRDFDNARKILQPDNINTVYINDKLNTGLP